MKRWWSIGIFLTLLVIFFLYKNRAWWNGDYRLGIVTPSGISIVSMSPKREMTNVLTVGEEVEVWLPGGMGWYASNRVKKIFEMDKNKDLIDKMFYYNFGFLPDKVMYLDSVENWQGWALVKSLGWGKWCRYKLGEGDWFLKTEKFNQSLLADEERLNKILSRDFSEENLNNSGIKMMVINKSEEDGLGAFVTKRLEWMGFNVVEVKNGEKSDNGRVVIGKQNENALIKKYSEKLAKIYNVPIEIDERLLPEEMELELGANYTSMVKYNSYK